MLALLVPFLGDQEKRTQPKKEKISSPQDVYHAMAHLQNANGQLDRKGYVTFLSSLEPKILLDKMHIAVPSGNSDMQPKMVPRFLLFFFGHLWELE